MAFLLVGTALIPVASICSHHVVKKAYPPTDPLPKPGTKVTSSHLKIDRYVIGYRGGDDPSWQVKPDHHLPLFFTSSLDMAQSYAALKNPQNRSGVVHILTAETPHVELDNEIPALEGPGAVLKKEFIVKAKVASLRAVPLTCENDQRLRGPWIRAFQDRFKQFTNLFSPK